MVMSGIEQVAIAIQPTLGSPVNPNILVPVLPGTFRATENFEQILDRGRRGQDTMDYRALQGVGWSEITWEGEVAQGDSSNRAVVGYLIDNLMGRASTSTQIGATGNYDHRLKLGTTKAYLTVEHDSGGVAGANDRRFGSCRVKELSFRFNAGEGSLGYTVTLEGRSPSAVTAQTPVVPAQGDAWMGWQGQATFGSTGSSFTRLISGEWTLRRSLQRFVSAQNSRNVTDFYTGPLEVLCSMVLDYSIVTDLGNFRDKDQSELSVEFITPLSGLTDTNQRSFGIGGSLFDLGDGPAELDNSGEAVTLGLTARGLYTTSNGPFSSTGNAASAQNGPVELQIYQPISTHYST